MTRAPVGHEVAGDRVDRVGEGDRINGVEAGGEEGGPVAVVADPDEPVSFAGVGALVGELVVGVGDGAAEPALDPCPGQVSPRGPEPPVDPQGRFQG